LSRQILFTGIDAVYFVSFVAIMVGISVVAQTQVWLHRVGQSALVGPLLVAVIMREAGPLLVTFIVIGRSGTAMAAELGSMRVTEQIDALETMAVEPLQYLIAPRVFATTVMVPLLTVLFNFVGIIGAYLVGVGILAIHEGPFMNRLYYMVDSEDIIAGVVKATFFGFLIAVISCYQGYKTKGGAAGVGHSTTRAVVLSSVTILVADYFLTAWILEFIIKTGR